MKVVSLSPSLTEIIMGLGASSMLSGVTDHCPEIEGAPRLGSPKALRLAEIEALRPEGILVDLNENRPEEIRTLQKNFKLLNFDVRGPKDAADAVCALGRFTGRVSEASKLAGDISQAVAASAGGPVAQDPVRALILIWNQPLLTVNFDTYMSRLVECAGGRNVFRADPLREFAVELEDMIEKEPELLFLAGPPYPFAARHAKKFREYRNFSKIPIRVVDGLLLSRFGPRTIEALETLKGYLDQAREARLQAGSS